MIKFAMLPLKTLGIAAVAGVGLGAGWKLGAYAVDVATGDKKLEIPEEYKVWKKLKRGEPLWKRQFETVTPAE
jgi:hypothetical protein